MQQRAIKEGKVAAHKKLIGRIFAKEYLKLLKPNTMHVMKDEGYFNTHFENDLYTSCIPWIYTTTSEVLKDETQIENFLSRLVIDSYNTAANEHQKTLQAERDRKEKLRQEKIQKEEEEARQTAQRRKERAEKRRLAEREKLKLRILEQIIKKGEDKEGILTQDFANVHGCFQSKDIIGVIGGVLTELSIVFTAVSNCLEGKDFLNEKNAYGIAIFYLSEWMKSKEFNIYLGPSLTKLLTTKNVKQEEIHTLDADAAKEFSEIYKSGADEDPILKIILENCHEIGIKPEAIGYLRNCLLKLMLRKPTDPDPKGKNMVAKQKLKLASLPENFGKDPTKPQAIWKISIPVPPPPEEDESVDKSEKKAAEDKKEKKEKKKEVNKSKKDMDTSKRSSAKGEAPEYEDKIAPVKPILDDIFIYVYHELGIKELRSDLCNFFKAKFTKDLETVDVDLIKEKAEEIGGKVEATFLEYFKDIPHFPD